MIERSNECPLSTQSVLRAIEGETSFTTLEYWNLNTLLRGLLGSLQDARLQKRAGLIDAVTIDYIELGVHYFLPMPVFAAMWSMSKPAYLAEAVELIDSLIAKLPRAAPVNLGLVLKLRLTKV